LQINGQTYTDLLTPIALMTGTEYTVAAVPIGTGGPLRGALVRIACPDQEDAVFVAAGLTGQPATACDEELDGAQGITHRDNSLKADVTGTLEVASSGLCTADVTVVDANNNVEGSIYWYSQYTLDFTDPPAPLTEAEPWWWFCFSSDMQVTVRHPGDDDGATIRKRMDELRIGDAVLTDAATETYTTVYSFGHYAPHIETEFLQIITDTKAAPLEITADHLLYRRNDGGAAHLVPAGSLAVGDTLVGNATVRAIRRVTKRGAYAPFTATGNLVVQGIQTSNYLALPPALAQQLSYEQQHWLQHLAYAPYRLYCQYSTCQKETYHEVTGLSGAVQMWLPVLYAVERWGLPTVTTALALVVVGLWWKLRTTSTAVHGSNQKIW